MTPSPFFAALGGALAATVLATGGCGASLVRADADEQAALFADTVLLASLQEEAGSASPSTRLAEVVAWLEQPDRDFLGFNSDSSWVVGEIGGARVALTSYYLWDDRSFAASRTWGRACVEYVVAEAVTVEEVACPADTPETPGPGAVGWDFR
ncbi:hypothetical protein [Jannaschia sp. R86511]|uniref:hypothetical protein n=1 Tax=Jannaschia sp. R86511 TaxID=3093853 RepID=UPI0036D3DBF9